MEDREYNLLKSIEITEATTMSELESKKLIDKYTAKFCKINGFNTVRDLLLYYQLLSTFEFCPYVGETELEQIMQIIKVAEEEIICVNVNSSDSVFIRKAYSEAMVYLSSSLNGLEGSISWAKDEYAKAYRRLKAMKVICERIERETKSLENLREEYRDRIKRIQTKNPQIDTKRLLSKLVRLDAEIEQFERQLFSI